VTFTIARTSALAVAAGAMLSLSALSAARADPAEPAPTPGAEAAAASNPTPSGTTPSLNEPAPTPSWAETGTSGGQPVQHRAARRHYADHRYARDSAVQKVATGVAGGVADLGSVAAYPFYCFPNYGSCPVRVPYRY
jgi:hypothetical protein